MSESTHRLITTGVRNDISILEVANDADSSLWVSALYNWASIPSELEAKGENVKPAELATLSSPPRAQK